MLEEPIKTKVNVEISRNERELSDDEIVNILWQSFLFSQGNDKLQVLLLQFANLYYGDQQINMERMEVLLDKFGKKINRGLSQGYKPNKINNAGLHTSQGAISEEKISNYFSYIERRSRQTDDLFFSEIFYKILDRDLFYLERGRPGETKKQFGDPGYKELPLVDKYFSYLLFFYRKGNISNVDWVDSLFNDLKKFGFEEKYKRAIEKLEELYSATHKQVL